MDDQKTHGSDKSTMLAFQDDTAGVIKKLGQNLTKGRFLPKIDGNLVSACYAGVIGTVVSAVSDFYC